MHELSAHAKNTTHAAISDGCAGRPMGLVNSFCALSFIVAGISGVHTVTYPANPLISLAAAPKSMYTTIIEKKGKKTRSWKRGEQKKGAKLTRPGRNGIHPNTSRHVLVAQTPRERHDGPLCRRVVQQVRSSYIRVDGRVVDDGAARLHVRQGVLGDVKVRVDIDVEGVDPLVLGQVRDVLYHHLV